MSSVEIYMIVIIIICVLIISEALKKAFPLKSDQDTEELLMTAQTELRSNGVRISYQTLYTEVSLDFLWLRTRKYVHYHSKL